MYIYIYTHTCTHTYTHTYVCIYIYIYMYTYICIIHIQGSRASAGTHRRAAADLGEGEMNGVGPNSFLP